MDGAVRVVVVPSARAEALRRELHATGAVDRSMRMAKRDGVVLIPIRSEPPEDLSQYDAHLADVDGLAPRPRPRNPREELRSRVGDAGIPPDLAPSRWERLGDVLIVRLPPRARRHRKAIGQICGETLGVRTVLEDVSGIHGPMRQPDVRVLWGDGTETIHVEDGVRYKLDVARVMFSSGNLAERTSIARRIPPGAVVADLFAGIGYFTLPIAVRARPKTIYACELNPVSFGYLLENLRLNRVSTVIPRLGDCRRTAPRGVADWVLLGHFDAPAYLDVAFQCLRNEGTVVYHTLGPRRNWRNGPLAPLGASARDAGVRILRTQTRAVKSYAPGIIHAVVEARVAPPPKGLSGTVALSNR